MSELVDTYELDNRIHQALHLVTFGDELWNVLTDVQAYMRWTVVQDAMKEVREIQKMTQRLLKEMD